MIEITGANLVAEEFESYPRRAQSAVVRALNRGGIAAKTFMARAVARDVGLRVTDVRAAFRYRTASRDDPRIRLAAGFKRIALIKFGARVMSRGVSYRIGAGSPRTRIADAFVAVMMPSGYRGVFARVSKARLPIRELHGPSLGQVFAKYRAEGQARGLEVFGTTMAHDLDRLATREATR